MNIDLEKQLEIASECGQKLHLDLHRRRSG